MYGRGVVRSVHSDAGSRLRGDERNAKFSYFSGSGMNSISLAWHLAEMAGFPFRLGLLDAFLPRRYEIPPDAGPSIGAADDDEGASVAAVMATVSPGR